MNIFEQATRQKFRFESIKGELTVEQLWDMPLTSKNGFDLDTVAKEVNRDLKACSEESFVNTNHNPAVGRLEAKLEVVKHVIAVKLAESDERAKAADRKAEKERLLEILHQKKDQDLLGLSREELEKRIAALG